MYINPVIQVTLEPNHMGRLFQQILVNNSALVIIKNTNKKNYRYFPVENWSGNIIHLNQVFNIFVFSRPLHFGFADIDLAALSSCGKPVLPEDCIIGAFFSANK